MNNQINWEEIMKATEQSAKAASRNSEHAVGGMVKLLERIDHHSSKLDAAKQELQQLSAEQAKCVQLSKGILSATRGSSRHSWRVLTLGLFASFVSGAAFAGFFVS